MSLPHEIQPGEVVHVRPPCSPHRRWLLVDEVVESTPMNTTWMGRWAHGEDAGQRVSFDADGNKMLTVKDPRDSDIDRRRVDALPK
jgi:hypothetical protein